MSETPNRSRESNDVAIVGIALHFPGAHGPAEFWSNLRAAVDTSQTFGDEELTNRGVSAAHLRDAEYVKRGYVLADLESFDAEFFGFIPRDAAILDPQHRHFLECAWEALEDAGHPPETYRGAIGVFGGAGHGSYYTSNLLTNPALVESVGRLFLRHSGNDKDFLTTRVSYCLDLRGPSVCVQAACSTSLVAVHLAVQSLLTGECDLALAGGVTIELPHAVGYRRREGESLSPDGRCRSFSDRSKGTVFSSGAGIVVLRRAEDAVWDGDRIYAIVRGSAINNNGACKVGFLAPSVDGQSAVVLEALAAAGVDADTIEYVEAHGDGTPMSEPIEVAALTRAFRRSTDRRAFCGLGSVKANIGHLDTAAGVASLIKVALALHHGELPSMPDFGAPNTGIPFASSPFFVLDRLQAWPRRSTPRRAGVHAAGVGGTNAHVVLEEAPSPARPDATRREWQLLCVSARSVGALDRAARRLAAHLRAHPDQPLADVAFTLLRGRHAFAQRRVVAARSHTEAAAELERTGSPDGTGRTSATPPPSVAFLLPGGEQPVRMPLELYESEPAFRAEIDRGIDALRSTTGRDLRSVWFADGDSPATASGFERPSMQLPANFVLEHALARFWTSLGVRPAVLLGHGLGETTAACLAGVFSFDDAVGLVALRGELLESLPDAGLLSVPIAAAALAPYLGADIDLAAVNAPLVTVVSGPVAALEDLARRLVQVGVEARRIPTATATHSRRVEPILPRFLEHLRGLTLHAPKLPFLSNQSGTWITAAEAVQPEYWADQLRAVVRFAAGVEALAPDSERVFLEVGPGCALSPHLRQHPVVARARAVIATLPHAGESTPEVAHFLTAFGQLWACGVPVDTAFPWRGESRMRVALPTYPFERQRHWIEPGRLVPATTEAAAPPEPVDLLTSGFRRPVWRPAPLQATRAAGDARAKEWLLLVDKAGLGERLARRLRARGERVITVREGDDDGWLGDEEVVLAPERGRASFDALVRELIVRGRRPERIVHAWLLTPDEGHRPGSNFFHRTQESGFYALLHLAQALGAEGVAGPMHASVVTNGLQACEGERVLQPGKATILGPVLVLPREFPGLTCASIDVNLALRRAGRSADEDLDALTDVLEVEVLAPPRNAVVAFRGRMRQEQGFDRVVLGTAGTNGAAPLRERGVYLVTGGLGGLGQLVAAHLARRVHARLVLVGRTPLPARDRWSHRLARSGDDDPVAGRIRAVQALESAGAEVYVATADVADIEAMRAVLAETERRFGALNGVVHAAGVLRDAPVMSKDARATEEVFASKVHGTLVLDTLLHGVTLDFLCCFSSISGIIGPPGQVDYVAASAFLDAYAGSLPEQRGTSGRAARRTLTIDWGVWRDAGMAADALRAPSATLGGAAAAVEYPTTLEHPLLDARASAPGAPLVLSARYTPRTRWVLDEHRTRDGCAVLPGIACLELARAALAEAGENPAFEVRDLVLIAPLAFGGEAPRDVEVELTPGIEGFDFQVRSRPARAASAAVAPWELHAEARLVMRTPPPAEALPIAQLEERTQSRSAPPGASARHATAAMPSAETGRMRLGPRWGVLRDLRSGTNETLATLELAPEFATDLAQFELHPALLDVVATCGHLGAGDEPLDGDDPWSTVAIASARVHAPVPSRIRSWVRTRAAGVSDDGLLVIDVVVADAGGRVCLELDGLALRRTSHAVQVLASPRAADTELDAPAHAHESGIAQRAVAESPARTALRRNVEFGIEAAAGMEAFERLLGSSGLARVVASSLDLEGLRREAESLVAVPNDPGAAFARNPPKDAPGISAPMDGIERHLIALWQELLGVRKVGLRDNFFDLGGHSLIAVRLFARIQKAYRVEFPLSLLFDAPTIERCAAAIRAATSKASVAPAPARPLPTHLVTLNASRAAVPGHEDSASGATPFFLVAGMFGNVLNLRYLARSLGEERRCYGLQARGLLGTEAPHETFEAMAAACLAELRHVQPEGPYLLGGFSGGGITAFEMARELCAAGEEVALLALLDTGLPSAPALRASERVRIHWARLRDRGPAYVAQWARDRWTGERARFEARRRTHPVEVRPTEFRSAEIGAAFRRALERYAVRPYPGVVTLFRPRLAVAHLLSAGRVTNAQREFLFHDNGWGAFAERVDVHEVPGDHDSMVLEPNVRVLAAKLRACLQSADPAARRAGPGSGRRGGGR